MAQVYLSAAHKMALARLTVALVISTVLTSIFAGILLNLPLLTTGQLFTQLIANPILGIVFLAFLYIGWLIAKIF